jgi:hypothetical protein
MAISYQFFNLVAAHITVGMVGCVASMATLSGPAFARKVRQATKSMSLTMRLLAELAAYAFAISVSGLACLPIPYLFLTVHASIEAFVTLAISYLVSVYWFFRSGLFGPIRASN